MRVLSIAVLLLHSTSFVTSRKNISTTSRLRGSESTKRNINNNNHALNDERTLEEQNIDGSSSSDDSRQRKETHAGGDLRSIADRKPQKTARTMPRGTARTQTEDSSDDSRQRKKTHAGGDLRSIADRKPKNTARTMPRGTTTTTQTEESLFENSVLFATESPTPGPTPTRTFIAEEAKVEVCNYCQGGCFVDTNVVTFSRGGRQLPCARIMEIAPSLTPFQCNIDHEIIKETCCCPPTATEIEIEIETTVRLDPPEVASPPPADDETEACDFCIGGDFLTQPTIRFENGSSTSCLGLQELLKVGMPPAFCKKERTAIEDACCQPNAQTEVIAERTNSAEKTSPVESRVDTTEIVGETEIDFDPVPVSPVINEDPCSFCTGQEFLTDPIILFPDGSNSVSCGGLKMMVWGLPDVFCRRQRSIIEETCCQPSITAESRVEVTPEPTVKPTSIPVSLTRKPSQNVLAEEERMDAPPPEEDNVESRVEITPEPTVKPTSIPVSLTRKPTQNVLAEEKRTDAPPPELDGVWDALDGTQSRVENEGINPNIRNTLKDGGVRKTDPLFTPNINDYREDFFSSPTGRVEDEDENENATIKDGGVRKTGPLFTPNINHHREEFFSTPTGRAFADLTKDEDETNAENSQVSQNDGNGSPEKEKSTGLFKVHPRNDNNNDAFVREIEMIRDAMQNNPRTEMIFRGGIYRGKAVTSSF